MPSEPLRRDDDRALDRLSVLVVDDNHDARVYAEMVLRMAGARVATAHSGSEALCLLDSLRFNLIVSDIRMPEMDGCAFIRKLRRRAPEVGGLTPAVALTALTQESDRFSVTAAGFQLHVPKPVRARELVRALACVALAAAPHER